MNSKLPQPPTIVSSEAIKCGRAIKVEWIPPLTSESAISPVTGYELGLKSTIDDSKQIVNLSSEVLSYSFDGLKINSVYEVSLRAKNSEGVGLPAKKQLATTAGTATGANY